MKDLASALKILSIFTMILISLFISGCLSEPLNDMKQHIDSIPNASTKNDLYNLDVSRLTIPEAPSGSPKIFEDVPEATSRTQPGFQISSHYQHTTFYEGSTGVVKILVENTGDTPIFISRYGIKFSDEDKWINQNTGITIPTEEEIVIGMISIEIPKGKKDVSLQLGLSLLAKTKSSKWYDYQTQFFDEFTVDVLPIRAKEKTEYLSNIPHVVEITNIKVDSSNKEVREIAANAAKTYPGKYNIYQVCALFDYTKENIQYISDPRGTDYWALPNETLNIGAGDCDDYSILLSSLIEAIGGTTRIYLTDTHAFMAVYIGNDPDHINKIVEAIGKYYGSVPVHYTTDKYGSWLMLDPTSSLYAGDLPSGTAPTTDGWTYIDTTTVTTIDIFPDK
ncbi:MAG: transglutaminase family protein [Methanosarcinaceae archaeon]|nr:transglutaminase family protein [Methanosarcinaceae archaeon]